MPIAVVIGGDPAVHLAAAAPLPAAVDPLGLAGVLREKPLDAVACRSIDLLVPAESDIVIEGYIDPADAETRTAPRFSPTGRIIEDQPGHMIHVTAMTHRANRIFPATVPGCDGNEVCSRPPDGTGLLAAVKLRIPELVDFDLPLSGGARHLAIIAIRKAYPGQARQVATVAWGMRPIGFAKLLVWSMRTWMSATRNKSGRRLPMRRSGPRRLAACRPGGSVGPDFGRRRTRSPHGDRRHAEICRRGPRVATSQRFLG